MMEHGKRNTGRRKSIAIGLIVILVAAGCWSIWKYLHCHNGYQPFEYIYIKKDTALKGYLFLAPYEIYYWRFGQAIIADAASGKVFYRRNLNGPVFCFRQWNIHGKTYYSYILNDPDVYHVPKLNLSAGYVVLMDASMHEINKIHLVSNDGVKVERHEDLDLHDFILLDENHYITLCAYEKEADNIPDSLHPAKGVKIVTPIIQEVRNGKVVWQWDGSRFPEFYAASAEQNHFTHTAVVHNYMHINSAFIDPKDSNLICSFRNTNQILKLSRKDGSIIWRLGGKTSDFAMEPYMYFLKQHDAKLIDSNRTLLVFDNGDSAKRPHSRILEFGLDEQSRSITSFKSYYIPKPYSQYMGSVDKIGDNYLICGGSSFYIMEVNSTTGQVLMDIKTNQAIYRTYLFLDVDTTTLKLISEKERR